MKKLLLSTMALLTAAISMPSQAIEVPLITLLMLLWYLLFLTLMIKRTSP